MYTFYSSVCLLIKPSSSNSCNSSKEFKESNSKSSYESLTPNLYISKSYKTISALDEQGKKVMLEVEVFDPMFARY